MSKRAHEQICPDEPMLRIKLADAEPLEADHTVVRMFSTVARGLPLNDQDCCWDLSNLLIDGQFVQRPVVVAWLNHAYQMPYASPYEQQQDSPASSMERLYKLLAFADAVGSTKGLLNACVLQLDQLELHAQLGQQQLALSTDGRGYCFDGTAPLRLIQVTAIGGSYVDHAAASGGEEKQAFIQQAAMQTEQLLWLACKLQLVPLQHRLHSFVRSQTRWTTCIFATRALADTIFSQRVLDAALGPSASRAVREAWIRSELLQHCDVVSRPFTQQLLVPTDITEQQKRPIKFNATLADDFMGTAKGTEVPVKLDLLGKGVVTIGGYRYKARLSIGPMI